MAISINGSSNVITGISVGGLPDGTVDADTLASNAVTAGKLASGVGGKVLQAVNNSSTTTVNTSGSAKSDLLTVTITPASTSNKVLVMAQLTTYTYPTNNAYAGAFIYRGTNTGTLIAQSVTGYSTTTHLYDNYSLKALDSPNTTSAQVYTLSISRQSINTNYITTDGYRYHLIAMEIAA